MKTISNYKWIRNKKREEVEEATCAKRYSFGE
jgi:hypothetical protein